MLKLTLLINKDCFADNIPLGKLNGIIWDKPGRKCNVITDSGCYASNKINFARGKIVLTNVTKINLGSAIELDKPVYDTEGKFLGKISDAEISKTLNLAKLAVSNGTVYTKGKIRAVNDIVIVKLPSPAKPKKEAKKTSQNVTPQNTTQQKIIPRAYPNRRRYGDFSFLIGKVSDKNIKNFYGEIMIRSGEKITADILRQAKISGKLVELCLHAN